MVSILDKKKNALCNMVVPLVKVQWQHRNDSELTWELESETCEHYLDLFAVVDFGDKI